MGTGRLSRLLCAALGWLALAGAAGGATTEYEFDLATVKKKPFHIGGFVEFRPLLLGLDRGAALHKLRFYGLDEGRTAGELNARLQLEASLEKGIARLFARANFDVRRSPFGWEHSTGEDLVYEGYLDLKPSPALALRIGKQTLLWGKGYAFNPAAFASRPKDPDDPELALEGYVALAADWVRSLQGALKTLAFTAALIPVDGPLNDDLGREDGLHAAAKLYFLFLDTDIDLIALVGKGGATRLGIDLSRNITSNFEVHGEFAWNRDAPRTIMNDTGAALTAPTDARVFLLGARYLSQAETTYILEYYRNGAGFSEPEMKDYFSFIDRGHDLFLATGSDVMLKQAAAAGQAGYLRPQAMKDYLYFRASQKDPFAVLYSTLNLTAIVNLGDRSASVSAQALYSGITNLELRLNLAALLGRRGSDFGEKPNDYRIELRGRYFF